MPSPVSKIPYLNLPDKPIASTTQDLLPFADIVDDLILFKDGGVAVVLESTSLNFGLLSEAEQEAVIAAYAALINSLSFSIQIVVRTLRKDITSYLIYLENKKQQIDNPKLKKLMESYTDFITETVKKKNVLGKRFFVVLPFSPLELGLAKSVKVATNTKTIVPFSKEYVLKKSKIVLYPRRDHLIRQGNRLGLRLTQLNNEQILELLYDIYNPILPKPIDSDEKI